MPVRLSLTALCGGGAAFITRTRSENRVRAGLLTLDRLKRARCSNTSAELPGIPFYDMIAFTMDYGSPSHNREPVLLSGNRPRIGITMRLELATARFYLGRHYSEAVEAAGGAPVHISLIPKQDYISAIIDQLDGILLPGSDSDVDPLRYGAEPHPNLGSVVTIKDETDLLVLEEVERRNLPLFAICFGMQILNVFRGGTLIQDIGSQVTKAIKHEQGAPRDRASHRIKLGDESMLSALAGGTAALVNSHHHQALDKVGRDLVETAWAADGLIEAVEDPRANRFALGVQWHPELGWERDPLSKALFARFVSAARERRQGVMNEASEVGANLSYAETRQS